MDESRLSFIWNVPEARSHNAKVPFFLLIGVCFPPMEAGGLIMQPIATRLPPGSSAALSTDRPSSDGKASVVIGVPDTVSFTFQAPDHCLTRILVPSFLDSRILPRPP